MSQKKVVVTLDDDAASRIKDTAKRLRSRGLVVQNMFEATGTITGECKADDVSKLNSVKGVIGVEEDQTMSVAPPDADVQ